jgi:SNF family Na+-dependent transporter
MRYFLIFLILLALWLLLDEFLLQDRGSEGLNSITEKLKDLGSRVHWSVGVLAVLIVVILVLRFLLRVLASP